MGEADSSNKPSVSIADRLAVNAAEALALQKELDDQFFDKVRDHSRGDVTS